MLSQNISFSFNFCSMIFVIFVIKLDFNVHLNSIEFSLNFLINRANCNLIRSQFRKIRHDFRLKLMNQKEYEDIN